MKLPKLYHIGFRFPKLTLFFSLVLTLLALKAASHLTIQNDLTSLLPQNSESVKGLEELKKYFGGNGYLIVTVEAEDPVLAEKFADAFEGELVQHPSILYVDAKTPVEFFKKRLWYYLTLDDLHEMEWRVDRALELQKKGVSSTFSHIMDFADPEDRPDLSFQDIFKKYEKHAGIELHERASDDTGQFLILRAKVKDQSDDLNLSRKLMSDVRAMEFRLKQKTDYPVTVGYTGGYATKIEQLDLIQKEVTIVSIIVAILLFLILLFYFKKIEAPFLIGIPLTISLVWTGGLVFLILGHLNVITSFGAAILGGLGSDYGIYLLTRYYHERKLGENLSVACQKAFGSTGRATYGSMITMVAGFGALLFSKFGVFLEFGIVGALGLITTYVVMMLIVPALLVLGEPLKTAHLRCCLLHPQSSRTKAYAPVAGLQAPSIWVVFRGSHFFNWLFIPRRPFLGVIVASLVCGVAVTTLPKQSKIYYEEGQMEAPDLPGNKLGERVNKTLGRTVDPTVLLARNLEEEKKIVQVLEDRLEDKREAAPVFDRVLGFSSFVPRLQEDKKKILRRLYDKLSQTQLILKSEKKILMESLQESLAVPKIRLEDIPQSIRRLFQSARDPSVHAIYLFPAFSRAESESMKLYQDGVYSLKDKLGPLPIADGTFIASDTVRLIEREAPRGMFLILGFFAVVLFIMVGSITRGLLILTNLIASLFLLSGVLWLGGIPLNVMNIAVIPVVLGGGVDIYIHLSHRFDEEGALNDILKTEIPAMFVSSLTSIVGFGGFLLVSSSGLRSIGWVAVLGLAMVTLMAAFVFPRCLLLGARQK